MKLLGTMFLLLLAACASKVPQMEDYAKEDLVLRDSSIMAAYRVNQKKLEVYANKEKVILALFEHIQSMKKIAAASAANTPADPKPTTKPATKSTK